MVELQPTGEVTEYSASLTDETLKEGKKGRHRVLSFKITLRAEGMSYENLCMQPFNLCFV